MKYKVSIGPDHDFPTNDALTILEAAKASGIELPYGCMVGACRVCRVRLKTGKVTYKNDFCGHLTEEEIEEGYFLPCCSIAQDDIELAQDTITKVPREGVVVDDKTICGDVVILKLKVSKLSKLSPTPGQYIAIECGNGMLRSYSIANIPKQDGYIELHIKKRIDGVFSDKICSQLKKNDVLWIRGPFGDFALDTLNNKPIIFIATGTGFAPIKAMLESGILNRNHPIQLYWGGRTQSDLYFNDSIKHFTSLYTNFQFYPTLSSPLAEENWAGRTGYVQDWIKKDNTTLHSHDVYACGSQNMIESAHTLLSESCNLNPDNFKADIFYAPS
ncbi:FAD-binding oxidoreductase [Vibrio sp. S4M6]|uniref:FAD-binding oxidoreductase n=1 Tax=Vibrio sinus TaxID=2946865 RepID=UPI002029C6E3|nr:FAD-binding oxidoreductase [Vibrio sinus]MCL9782232.1 FAD-binding oxidoreductase [Vibrio sinus]